MAPVFSLPSLPPLDVDTVVQLVHSWSQSLTEYGDALLGVLLSDHSNQLRVVQETTKMVLCELFGVDKVFSFLKIAVLLQSGLLVWESLGSASRYCLSFLTQRGRRRQELLRGMHDAKSFQEWHCYATELDKQTDALDWREIDNCQFYDEKSVRTRIHNIESLVKREDVFSLMFRLRGGLSRDKFGVQHEGLYSRALSGTKNLINKYTDTVAAALQFIATSNPPHAEIPAEVKLQFFNETRHAYGRSALLLSGGAYLGYYHMGVVRSLFLQGLLPKVISGASAGSLNAAVVGTKRDDELLELITAEDETQALFRKDYFNYGWQKHPVRSATLDQVKSLLAEEHRWIPDVLYCAVFDPRKLLLDIGHLKEVVIHNVGEYTFQEAFDRTGRIINITVAPSNNYDPPRLLNYLTAPHVCVWSAAVASCAIPGMFDAVPLIVKEPNGEFRAEHKWHRRGDPHMRRSGSRGSFADMQRHGQSQVQGHGQGQGHHRTPHAAPQELHKGGQSGSFGTIVHAGKTGVVAATGAPVVRDDLVLYTDGSVESDLPMQQIAELFNVNHFIVSQVNAHSCLFSASSVRASVWSPALFGACVGYVRFLIGFIKDWVGNVVDWWVYRLKAPIWASRRGLAQLLTQEYEGREQDITIMPWKDHISLVTAFANAIKNPTDQEFLEVLRAGEKATWPHVARIQVHCKVESVLDSCVQKIRADIENMENFAEALVTDAPTSGGESPKKEGRRDNFFTSRSSNNLLRVAAGDSGAYAGSVQVQDHSGRRGGNRDDTRAEVVADLSALADLNDMVAADGQSLTSSSSSDTEDEDEDGQFDIEAAEVPKPPKRTLSVPNLDLMAMGGVADDSAPGGYRLNRINSFSSAASGPVSAAAAATNTGQVDDSPSGHEPSSAPRTTLRRKSTAMADFYYHHQERQGQPASQNDLQQTDGQRGQGGRK